VLIEPDEGQRDKIVSTLGLRVPPRELKHSDPLVQLRAVMGQWLPLGRNVLRAVVQQLPSAADSQAARLAHLCAPLAAIDLNDAGDARGGAVASVGDASDDTATGTLPQLRRAVEACDGAPEAPLLVHVAKMVYTAGVAGAHVSDAFVGLARLFCGTLEPGRGGRLTLQRVAADGMPTVPEEVAVDGLRLYVLMGRELVPTPRVIAGAVFGLGGLGDALIKSATLCSLPACPPFAPLALQGAPIVQVAVEPQQLGSLPRLEAGLRLLARADPSVDVAQLPSGEHVISTCGEVHLERCLHDLRTAFAPGLEIVVSPPIVPLRESVAADATGLAEAPTPSKLASVTMRALRLPAGVRAKLLENQLALKADLLVGSAWVTATPAGLAEESARSALAALRDSLRDEGHQWRELEPLSAALRGACANLLLCTASVAQALRGDAVGGEDGDGDEGGGGGSAGASGEGGVRSTYDQAASGGGGGSGGGMELLPSVLSGFQLAASSGPLCEEPLDDLAFVLEELVVPSAAAAAAAELQSGELEGQLIVATKEACRAALLACSPRVLEPVYLCELQTSQDSMGKTYGVLSKRRAQILSEELKEGTPIFTIRAHLPVAESFGFATDLRKTTSGAAHPQLVFAHFEALPQDPNFAVTSEEDQEALDDGDIPTINLARKLVDDVRRRKGLRVEEKVVQSATKQRTRTKMK